MSDEEKDAGVWVVYRLFTSPLGAIPKAIAYVNSLEEGKKLAEEVSSEMKKLVEQSESMKGMLGAIGASGMSFSIEFVPRHSPIELPHPPTRLVVAKA
jgi:hypothetical protein